MSNISKKLMCLVAFTMFSFTTLSSSAFAKTNVDISSNPQVVEESRVSSHGLPDSTDDGIILHAWNWSFNNIRENMKQIAEAGYNTIQTSPAQACRLGETWDKAELEQTNDKPTWHYLYQPTYFTLGNEYLGSAEEFKAMCDTAHKYDVKIIVDVVANHLADCGTENADKVDKELYDEARKCSGLDDPNRITGADWKIRDKVTQGCCIGMPDIDTTSKTAQNKIGSYLKECVENGADGFRFDAAKSIELPEKYERPGAKSSDFWPNIIGMADSAASTENKKLFYYGETLQTDEPGTNTIGYTNIMKVTGSQYGFCLRKATGYVMWQEEVKGKDEIRGDGANRDPGVDKVSLDMVEGSWSPDGLSAAWVANPTSIPEGTHWSMDEIPNNKYVSWVENHDLYANAGATRCMDKPRREVAWALMTARDKIIPLFFNRPVDTDFGTNANSPQGEAYKPVGERGTDDFASKNVTAINRFHNAMVGEAEKISTAQGNGNGGDPKILIVNRGSKGTAIINTAKESEFEAESSLPDGEYDNQGECGGKFTVSGGKISGKIPANGIIILYKPEDISFDDVKDDDTKVETSPTITSSLEDGSKFKDSIKIKLTVKDAKSASYTIDNGDEKTFTGSTEFVIGKDTKEGKSVTVKVKAINGSKTTNETFTFMKEEEKQDPPEDEQDPPEDEQDPPEDEQDPPEDEQDPPTEKQDITPTITTKLDGKTISKNSTTDIESQSIVNIKLNNAESATYKIGSNSTKKFTSSQLSKGITINDIADGLENGDIISLEVIAINGDNKVTNKYKFWLVSEEDEDDDHTSDSSDKSLVIVFLLISMVSLTGVIKVYRKNN